jgi:hypothetical protein
MKTTKTKAAKTVRTILLLTLVSALALALSACSALKDAAEMQAYTFGNEKIPSINSVVGQRDVTGVESGKGTDGDYQEYTYTSNSAVSDIQKYIDLLQDEGWVVTINEGNASSGKVQVGNESAQSGYIFLVTIEYTTTSYTLNAKKYVGTLDRY